MWLLDFFNKPPKKSLPNIRPFDLFGSTMMKFLEEDGIKLQFRAGKRGLTFQDIGSLEELNFLLQDFDLFAEYGTNFQDQAIYLDETGFTRLVSIEPKKGSKSKFNLNLKKATKFLFENNYLHVFYWP